MADCDLPEFENRIHMHPCPSSGDWNSEWQYDFNQNVLACLQILSGCIPTVVAANKLKRFKLTADLTLGGSATANLQTTPSAWVDDPDGLGITVHDRTESPGRWQGVTGVYGWCQLEDGTDYSIIEIDEVAQWVIYQLTEHLLGSSASATVILADNGLDPGSTITVHDPLGIWKQWHRYSCVGMARWFREQAKYMIVGGPQLVERRRQATLVNGTCPDTILPPYANLEETYSQGIYSGPLMEIDTDPMSPTYGQYINVTQVPLENYIQNKGSDGDRIIIEAWYYHDDAEVDPNPDTLKWEYEISEPIAVIVATGTQFQEPCTLKQTLTTIYTQWCAAESSEVIDIPFTQEELVDSVYSFSTVDTMIDPELWVCQIRYTTSIFCVIRVDDGGDYLAADFERHEYMKNWDVVNDVLDPEFDPPNYRIKYQTRFGWWLCDSAGSDYYPQDLKVYEHVYEFRVDDDAGGVSPTCVIVGITRKIVVFDLEGGNGAEVEVVDCIGRVVLTAVSDDGSVITFTRETLYVICFNAETSSTLDVETC